MDLVGQKISEGKVLELIRSFLTQGVMESHKGWETNGAGNPPRGGCESVVIEHLPQWARSADGP